MSSDKARPTTRRLWIVASTVAIAASIILLELTLAAGRWLIPGLFPSRAGLEQAIDQVEQEEFDAYAKSVVPPMMWDHRPNSTAQVKSCMGTTFTARYDASGARTYQGFRAHEATVLLVGDSYTHGDEVADDETIAAHLFARSAIAAANLGVGGYSPLQAVLKAKAQLERFPEARVVVLGVMYENIRRTVNSYSPAFTKEPSGLFAARPHALPDEIQVVPPAAYTDLAAFKQFAKAALRQDFWHAPDLSFPYTLSLAELAGSKAFRLRQMSRLNKLFGRQYQSDFADPTLRSALFTVVQDFFSWASAAKIEPVVVFIPQNKYDLQSAQSWIDDFAQRLAYPANLRAMATDEVDWSRYNQNPDGSCHPSSYGYAAIASAYARIIKSLDTGRR